MPVDCVNQMIITSVRGTEIRNCCLLATDCKGPAHCLTGQYHRNLMAHDIESEDADDKTTTQVGSAVWERINKNGGKL